VESAQQKAGKRVVHSEDEEEEEEEEEVKVPPPTAKSRKPAAKVRPNRPAFLLPAPTESHC
jgi:hypothetical protein